MEKTIVEDIKVYPKPTTYQLQERIKRQNRKIYALESHFENNLLSTKFDLIKQYKEKDRKLKFFAVAKKIDLLVIGDSKPVSPGFNEVFVVEEKQNNKKKLHVFETEKEARQKIVDISKENSQKNNNYESNKEIETNILGGFRYTYQEVNNVFLTEKEAKNYLKIFRRENKNSQIIEISPAENVEIEKIINHLMRFGQNICKDENMKNIFDENKKIPGFKTEIKSLKKTITEKQKEIERLNEICLEYKNSIKKIKKLEV